jgi:hypothetical protein
MNFETEDELLDYVRENYEVFDRFTFDYLFKRLLADSYGHEEAKDIILHNCALSTLVMQERLHNRYYLEISADQMISPDLAELREEIANEILLDKILKIL